VHAAFRTEFVSPSFGAWAIQIFLGHLTERRQDCLIELIEQSKVFVFRQKSAHIVALGHSLGVLRIEALWERGSGSRSDHI